jgi:hypothetical protein
VSRLVVVLPLLPLGVGDGFSLKDWPLHLTVAPTFVIGGGHGDADSADADRADADSVDADRANVLAAVTPILTERSQLIVQAGSDAGFGHSGKIPVTLIEPTAALSGLHHRLVEALLTVGAAFDDPQFIGDGYRPHVTLTRSARVSVGDTLTLRQAALVDMAPAGERRLRRVVWAHSLR